MKRKQAVRLVGKKFQRGWMLAELLIAVTLLGGILSYYGVRAARETSKEILDNRARLVGTTMKDVAGGAATYSTLFYEQVQLGQAVTRNGYTVPAADVLTPTTADLRSLGLLEAKSVNPIVFNGQSIAFSIRFTVDTSTGCAVPSCALTYQVATTTALLDPRTNAADIRRATLAANTASPGNAGVSMPATMGGNPNIFVTTAGSQTGVNAGGVAGLVALNSGYDSQGFSAFLRRDGTLPMTGNLNLQDTTGTKHDLINGGTLGAVNVAAINTVTGNKVISTARMETGEYLQILGAANENGPCERDGLVGIVGSGTSSGLLLSCQSLVWKRQVTPQTIPSGSVCGSAIGNGDWYQACEGYVPVPLWGGSCPPGFTMRTTGMVPGDWNTSGNDQPIYSCLKW
jgi:hypothetical protein